MKRNKYLFTVFILSIFIIPIWITWTHDQPNERNENNQQIERFQSNTNVKATMDQVLADDLSLTTSFFITRLSKQLQHWKEIEVNSKEWQEKFKQEIAEHEHIHSLAIANKDKIEMYRGDMSKDKILKLLDKKEKEDVIYSDPFVQDEDLLMIIAHKKNNEDWLVGEVNLSFVKEYVKDLASVTDANGNLFISSSDDVQIEWKTKGENGDNKAIKQSVPELDWEIVVHTQEEKEKQENHYKEGEAVVRFKDNVNIQEWLKRKPKVKIRKENGIYYVLVHDSMSTTEFLSLLRSDVHIQTAEPNYTFTKQQARALNTVPNDEFYDPYQWNLSQIKSERGWNITGGTDDVIIAILDTGIDPQHEDLSQKIITGYNAIDGSDRVHDGHGHGTHVAGIAAAITNNITGIAGVSWYNPIMPVKVLNDQGEGSLFEVANGIKWATDHGARVINLSLGDAQDSEILYEAILYAYERDVVLIAAAGNDNVAQPMYPAGYEEVMAVSAVDQEQRKAVFSNYGTHIDVSAPGENIPSTFPNNHYVFMSGTSMAAPHVTGLAGLIRSLRPELNNNEVLQLIRETADDLGTTGHDSYFGFGQINVASALQSMYVEGEPPNMYGRDRMTNPEWLSTWVNKIRGLEFYFPGKRINR